MKQHIIDVRKGAEEEVRCPASHASKRYSPRHTVPQLKAASEKAAASSSKQRIIEKRESSLDVVDDRLKAEMAQVRGAWYLKTPELTYLAPSCRSARSKRLQ